MEGRLDIWLYSVSERKSEPFIASKFEEMKLQWSPDGKWVAYQSDESGEPNIYVQAFPGPATSRRVSPAGGTDPRWRRDGRELFYLAPGGWLEAIDVIPGPPLLMASPRRLFQIIMTEEAPLALGSSPYDVAPDGQRFLVNVPAAPPAPFTLVQGWTEKLAALK